MSDPQIDDVLKKIDAYDGTEERFQAIVADALALVPERPTLSDLQKELARRCQVSVSTVDRYARGASCPGKHVRPAVLGEIRDILMNRS